MESSFCRNQKIVNNLLVNNYIITIGFGSLTLANTIHSNAKRLVAIYLVAAYIHGEDVLQMHTNNSCN